MANDTKTDTVDPIAQAVEAAKAAAEKNAQTNAVATAQPVGVATAAPAAKPRSLEDAMASAGTSVDSWIQVKEDGFTINKNLKSKVETVSGTITPGEVKFGYGVRFTPPGGKPTYFKSYNGVTEARTGKPWADLVAQCQQIDPSCKGQYDLADIPIVITTDMKNGEGGTLPAGSRIGYSTPVTGYAVFMAWLGQAMQSNPRDRAIPVELFVSSKNGPTGAYPVMDFRSV